ncbi:MAG: hypothetical protein IH946_11880 [Bacteroidetes bacterium]|nr:hypothetical protein [Bacteroidota bacterium]
MDYIKKNIKNPLIVGPDWESYKWAKKVAEHLGTDHTELYCSANDAFEIISKLPQLYDEPFGDASAIPTFLVSRLAKQQVKVALSADGGDEQFCGYDRYYAARDIYQKTKGIPFSNQVAGMIGLMSNDLFVSAANTMLGSVDGNKKKVFRDKLLKLKHFIKEKQYVQKYDHVHNFFLEEDLKALGLTQHLKQHSGINPAVAELSPMSQSMYYDLNTYLIDDVLVKMDRASMGVSLEGREPFLDNHILELSSVLPESIKSKNGESKYILKKILGKYVPKEYYDRPKMGFNIPVYEWFREDLKGLYQQYLNKERINLEGIFNGDIVDKYLQEYLSGKEVYPFKLWHLFVFQVWQEKYL